MSGFNGFQPLLIQNDSLYLTQILCCPHFTISGCRLSVGDVPWIDKPLDETSEEAYGTRMPRLEVADKVLERLQWAEQNIGDASVYEKKDGSNTINRDCVRAALSRFTLREATWRKYHELGSYDKYFDECIRVSKLLMADYPTLYYGTDGQPAAGLPL